MTRCAACGLPTLRHFCHFCTRTVELIRGRLCVGCTAPIEPDDVSRQEGRCLDCRMTNARLSAGTRYLLILAAKARYSRRYRARKAA